MAKLLIIHKEIYNGSAGEHFLKFGLLKMMGLIKKIPRFKIKTK